MKISKDRMKAAIDEYKNKTTPPDGFFPVSYYAAMYPDETTAKISSLLRSMVSNKKAERSKNKYPHPENRNPQWFYKIIHKE